VSTVTVTLRLRRIEDLFRTPDLDPFSEWYQAYSDEPAISYVEARVGDELQADHLDLVIGLPRGAVQPGMTKRVLTALDRYCDARLANVRDKSRRNNGRGWLMLAFSLVVVSTFLFVSHRLDQAGYETFSVLAEGLSIAAWLLLWHPLEALVFNRWDLRLDRRVLKTIRYATDVHIQELEAPT
jgi:hypothetical protein